MPSSVISFNGAIWDAPDKTDKKPLLSDKFLKVVTRIKTHCLNASKATVKRLGWRPYNGIKEKCLSMLKKVFFFLAFVRSQRFKVSKRFKQAFHKKKTFRENVSEN